MNTADELRAAAAHLRQARFPAAMTATAQVAALIRARLPLAEWLEHEAEIAATAHLYAEREPCGWCGSSAEQHALAVARALAPSAGSAAPTTHT